MHRVDVVAQRGATEAEIAEVYRRRYTSFLRLGYALLAGQEQARDAVQETFATALRERASFRGEGSLDAWLWRTMLNVCRQEQRRRTHYVDSEPPDQASNGHPPKWPELRAAVAALPEQERTTLFLYYYASLTQAECAEALGVRPGTVAATLNHARAKLRAVLGTEVTR